MKRARQVIVPIGPGIAYVELTRGMFSIIDAIDADIVSANNWHAMPCRNTFYARRGSRACIHNR
jgi:hypothetical protein